jgi:hypothetical protein
MQPPTTCQSCRQTATAGRLSYKRGSSWIHHEVFLQCDVCERFACAECLQVYDILSGYDFLCHECAREFGPASSSSRGH